DSEYVQLLEAEYTGLRERVDDLTAHMQLLTEEGTLLTETSHAQIRKLTYDLEVARAEQQRLSALSAQSVQQMRVLAQLRDLPDTLLAMLDTVARLFPTRVRVTERARAAAEAAAIGATRDVRHGWRLLHALATSLYDLVFADTPSGDIQARF